MGNEVSVVVLDLDNTLWDWVHMWYRTFGAELDELARMSGIDREQLKREIREVHQRHGTSEYAFLIEEIPSLRAKHPGQDLAEVYKPAIDAFRSARKEALSLFDGVEETLDELRRLGCLLVGYTESMAFYTSYRIRKLGLDGKLQYLYSPADHDLPKGLSREDIRKYPAETYELQGTEHRNTPAGELKPNPRILRTIIKEVGADPELAIYIGDSLMKDIPMAQDAGIRDVYAEYGKNREGEAYELLREVTHWTEKDVERERLIDERPRAVPTYTLKESLREVFDFFTFSAFEARSKGVKT